MPTSGSIQVVLVKSGVTAWDAVRRCTGSADLPLCPEGRKLAEVCAGELAKIDADAVMCGPDAASQETAAMLAQRVGAAKVRVVEGWAEPGMGLWEGQSDEELAERFPKAFRQWKQDPSGVNIPEAEPLEEAQTRILEEFAKVLSRRKTAPGRSVIAVLRPTALALVICWLESRPLSELWTVVGSLGASRSVEIDRARLKRPRVGTGAGAGR